MLFIITAKQSLHYFQTLCLQDVTHNYITTYDITVSLFPKIESQWVYLAVYNDSEWGDSTLWKT